MKRLAAIAMILGGIGSALASEPPEYASSWRLSPAETVQAPAVSPLLPFFPGQAELHPLLQDSADARPRLSVSLFGQPAERFQSAGPGAFSWSIDAWQMNTASLAHIQCSRATRTLESFLVEDCRFVDRPEGTETPGLVQIGGQWLAAPGLSLGASVYSGQVTESTPSTRLGFLENSLIAGLGPREDRIEGANLNLSFGVQAGPAGDILLDLRVARYRRQASSMTALAGINDLEVFTDHQYQTAGQLALGWRKSAFSAAMSHNYRELPYWFGARNQGQSFSSFDIEFSWRAPSNSSISLGVSNLLDRSPTGDLPGESKFDDPLESIYGRIPYVRYKHDL